MFKIMSRCQSVMFEPLAKASRCTVNCRMVKIFSLRVNSLTRC